jgi:hypothetical protein
LTHICEKCTANFTILNLPFWISEIMQLREVQKHAQLVDV